MRSLFDWRPLLSRWLDKRIPAAQQFQLDLNNIFIFPARFGWFFLLLCILLFLLGTNYQNNLMLLLCYFLLSIFLVSLFSSYLNFASIHLQLGKLPAVYAGDNLHVPLWLNAKISTDDKAKPIAPHGLLDFNFWQQPTNYWIDADKLCNPVTLDFPCPKRGKIKLPRVTVASFYPLGLFRCWSHLAFNNEILVYPKPQPCSIQLDAFDQSSNEGKNISSVAGHDDFDSLKAYQKGEPLHHVSWKQLAKGQGMVSKQFVSSSNQSGWLRLLPCSHTELETRLSQLCFQVLELSRSQEVFGLDLGNTCITPNSGITHRDACLQALAVFQWRNDAE